MTEWALVANSFDYGLNRKLHHRFVFILYYIRRSTSLQSLLKAFEKKRLVFLTPKLQRYLSIGTGLFQADESIPIAKNLLFQISRNTHKSSTAISSTLVFQQDSSTVNTIVLTCITRPLCTRNVNIPRASFFSDNCQETSEGI